MRIIFYGSLADMLGRDIEIAMPEGGCTIGELRRQVARQYPQAEAQLMRPSMRACVDDTVVGEDFMVLSGHLVEFFPPLSGG